LDAAVKSAILTRSFEATATILRLVTPRVAVAPNLGGRTREKPAMPLSPEQLPAMTLVELAQELHKREDSLDHLMAKAEVQRRQSQAQLDACVAQERACATQERNARYMLWSAIASAVSAFAAAVATGVVVYTFLGALVVE
jgi:hypothetical protein